MPITPIFLNNVADTPSLPGCCRRVGGAQRHH